VADKIITPCNAARSWHWFHQVTAPCNVAYGSGIMTELTKVQHPAMWYVDLGYHAVEFARWQHPAVWEVAAGWHDVEFAMLKLNMWFRFRTRHMSVLHTIILNSSNKRTCSNRFVNVSLHQSAKFYPYRTTLSRKNDVMSIYNIADLSHLGF